MQIAVISDIHGNCFALDKALEDIRRQGIEQIVCLGDAIQGGAQPGETVERLREIGCPVVMGNADAWLLAEVENSPQEQVTEQQLAVKAWSLARLSSQDRAFIQQFQPTIELALEAGQKLLCFHGSPRSFNDIILPNTSDEALGQLLGGFDAAFFTGGHTHTQQLRHLEKVSYFNPGSIGLAYIWQILGEKFEVAPWGEYAIVTSEAENTGITFRRVPFELDELVRIIRASGRPFAEEAISMYR
ncbi:MAG TPA: metallophosphoesterase family protein [Ktedonobacteraceae bacterium]